jgi:hypothetical protein
MHHQTKVRVLYYEMTFTVKSRLEHKTVVSLKNKQLQAGSLCQLFSKPTGRSFFSTPQAARTRPMQYSGYSVISQLSIDTEPRVIFAMKEPVLTEMKKHYVPAA